jgi:RimJ/RimL family protein N-acetyltransferase
MLLHHLPDGRPFLIRPIRPSDAADLQDGLRRLSQATIQRRFLAAKPRFTASELRYLTEVDGVNHLALVAHAHPRGHVVAVARAVRRPEDPRAAEWAIVVADPLQRQGLGTALVRALAAEAQRQGIHRFTGTVAGENRAVLRLLDHVTDAFHAGPISRGVREVVADLAHAA